MSFKKKLLKGVLHVSTGGTTYLAEKGIKAVKKKLENRKTQKLAKQKQDEIRTKRKKLELEVNEQKKINEARKLSNDNLKKKIRNLLDKKLSVKEIIDVGFEKDLVLIVEKELKEIKNEEKIRKQVEDEEELLNKLLKIPGINDKLAKYIAEEFKSINGIKKVSLERLLETPELSKKQAGAIKKL